MFGLRNFDTKKNGSCSGWTRFFSCQVRVKFGSSSGQVRVKVRVNFGSSSCQVRVKFRVKFRVNFGSNFVSISGHFGSISCRGSSSCQVRVAGQIRVACQVRVAGQVRVACQVRFVSCQPNSGSCRVRVAVSCRFRVTGRVRVGEEKIRHGSNTTRTRHETRIDTPNKM